MDEVSYLNIPLRSLLQNLLSLFKKILRYTTICCASLMAVVLLLVYVYQDQIIQRFIAAANQYIDTPVQVEKMSVSTLEQFPFIAITFNNVRIQGSMSDTTQPLAVAEKLYFTFNPIQLLRGNYIISQIYLAHAQVFLYMNTTDTNYNIFKNPTPSASPSDAAVQFRLKHITLSDVHVTYVDQPALQEHHFLAEEARAALQVASEQYHIDLTGQVMCEGIGLDKDVYFKQKMLDLDATMLYDYSNRHLTIHPSTVHIGQGEFLVAGNVQHAQKNVVNLDISGKNTDLQTLTSLLPSKTTKNLSAYKSKGDVYLSGKVQGTISAQENPLVELSFGCDKASFYHPEYHKSLEAVSMTGSFTNGADRGLRTSELILQNIEATLDGKPVTGNFSLKNFDRLLLDCQATAELDINSLLAFYAVPEIRSASGMLKADFAICGSLKDLQDPHAYRQQRVRSSGDITLQNIRLQLKKTALPLHAWNGNLMFKNNNIALHDLSGYIGNSHFLFNGLFRNALAYALTSHQYIDIQADLYSSMLDVDELLSDHLSAEVISKQPAGNVHFQTTAEKQLYQFSISPRLIVNFSCQVDKLKFRRLKAQQVAGKLTIKNSLANISGLSLQAAGGKLLANSTVDAQSPNNIQVSSDLKLQGLHLDSVFYVFEDFDQTFLTSRNLKGKTDADIHWELSFNQQLHLNYPALKADVFTSIQGGELNNFEPMQALSRFMDAESLSRLRFDDVRNHIRIANQTITIPRMQVRNNVSDITIAGTHTFAHQIDYHFELPMRSFSIRTVAARERAQQRARTFGNIADDPSRPLMLFLKAQGTVDDYKISYDMPAAHTQFKENLRQEKQELKETFQQKGQPRKKVELTESEYFDF